MSITSFRLPRLLAALVVGALVTSLMVVLPQSALADHGPTWSVTNSAGDSSTVEMDEGDSLFTPFTFTVRVSSNPVEGGETLTVDYLTEPFTAAAGSDYTSTSGTLSFPPGVTSRTVTVQVIGDTVLEDNEIFFLGLRNQSQGTITGPGTGSIVNDDGPSISIDDVEEAEGDSGTTDFVFNVSLSGPNTKDTTVDYATLDGSATSSGGAADYQSTSGTIEFKKGETTKTVTVKVNGDTTEEPNETFTVQLSAATGGATIQDGSGEGLIVNDDAEVNLFVDDTSVVEGDGFGTMLEFTVRAVGDSTTTSFQFAYQTQDGTASAPGDYTPRAGIGEVDLGSSTTISVPVVGDNTPEAFETVMLVISNAQDASIADGTGTGTIQNDDATVSIDDLTVGENVGTAEFLISLDFPVVQDLDIEYDARNIVNADGIDGARASEGADFDEPGDDPAMVTIPASQTQVFADVEITNDSLNENDEKFLVEVTDTDGQSGGGEAVGTITDNDAQPTISVVDKTVAEGTGGNSSKTFTVQLSTASGRSVSIDYATRDGSGPGGALAGSDYVATSGTVAVPAGSTTANFSVDIIGDTSPEGDEHFFIDLSNPDGATVADGTGTMTIEDDDDSVGVIDTSVDETDGVTTVNVKVRRGEATSDPVTFDWTTAESARTNKATADVDYDSASGSGTIPANQVETTIPITINGDTTDEADEYFDVVISNVEGGIVIAGDERGEVKINDDDGTSLSVADAAADERDGTIEFTVSLTATASSDVDFDWATSNGTATATSDELGIFPPSPGDDYDDDSGSGAITAGDLSTTITVNLPDDADAEDDETFVLTLSNVSSADVSVTVDDDEAIGTIRNDDVEFTIADSEIGEGNSGTKAMVFTITTPFPSTRQATAEYDTADDTAEAGSDYVAVAGGAVTLNAGKTSTTVSVTVNGDTVDEDDETFDVTLSNPSAGASIAGGDAVGTIRDDEGMPSLSVSDVAKAEGDSGTTDYVFTISLSGATSKDVTVDVATADDTAEAGSDYVEASGTVEIPAGSTVGTFTVQVAGDTEMEDDEQFLVELSNPTNAVIGDGTGIGTINDDDTPGSAVNDPPTVDGGSDRAVETAVSVRYEATTSDPDGDTVTVTWDFGDGTAPRTGNPVSHTYAGRGMFTVKVTASDGRGGTDSDTFTVNAFDTGAVGRSFGDSRIETAVAASQSHWPDNRSQASSHTGTPATDAILAYAYKYPDALAAGPLAAKLDAPILLSDSDALPKIVEDELARLGVDTVWLVGGPNSLSPAVAQRLAELGYDVERLDGANRFETAAAVAAEVGRNSGGEVVLTLGDHADQNRAFPDALSAGSLAASPQQLPVLLTNTDAIPDVIVKALDDLNTKKVWIVGGASSVSTNVESRLRGEGYQTERLSGPGRYETSVDVAEEALSRAPAGPVRLVFATGAKFPDGLAGGGVAARVDGILLLVPNGELPEATVKFLQDNADRFDRGHILGGTSTLSASVRTALAEAMQS